MMAKAGGCACAGASASVAEILTCSMLTAGMGGEEIAELLASSKVHRQHYRRGEVLFHDGDRPQFLYILLAGEVHILKDTFSGRRIFISEVGEPGNMFGEVYNILGQPYDIYVEAAEDSDVLMIASSYFTMEEAALTRGALLVQRNLMRIFAKKAYFMHGRIKVLASGSLREKIVRLFFQSMKPDGTVELMATREYLAAYLAVTRPSLSRELGAMQKDGLIAIQGKRVKVLDMERFEEYL